MKHPDISNWQPCDIILTAGDTSQSDIIRKATKQSYSHAMLYLGNGQIVEAVSSGVSQKEIAVAFKDVSKYATLRVIGLTSDQCRKILDDVVPEYIGKKYSYWGATSSISSWCDTVKSDGKVFCSQMIVEIFEKGEIKLTDKPATCTTPGDFENLPLFETVVVVNANPDTNFTSYWDFAYMLDKEHLGPLPKSADQLIREYLLEPFIFQDVPFTPAQKQEVTEKVTQMMNNELKKQNPSAHPNYTPNNRNPQKRPHAQPSLNKSEQQRRIDQKSEQQRSIDQVNQKVQHLQQAAQIGTFLLNKIFPESPMVARAFSAVASAGISLYASSQLFALGAIGPVGFALAAAGAVLSIFSIFNDDAEAQRHAEIMKALGIISKQLEDVSEQIAALHLEMRERFVGLHRHLSAVHQSLAVQSALNTFAILEQLQVLQNQVDKGLIENRSNAIYIRANLQQISQQLNNISERLPITAIQGNETSLATAINHLNEHFSENDLTNIFTYAQHSALEIFTSKGLPFADFKNRISGRKGIQFSDSYLLGNRYLTIKWDKADPRDINYNWAMAQTLPTLGRTFPDVPNFIEMAKSIHWLQYYGFVYANKTNIQRKTQELLQIALRHQNTLLNMADPSFIKEIGDAYLTKVQNALAFVYNKLQVIEEQELSNLSPLPASYHTAYIERFHPAVVLEMPFTLIANVNQIISSLISKQEAGKDPALSEEEEAGLYYGMLYILQNIYPSQTKDNDYLKTLRKTLLEEEKKYYHVVKAGDTLSAIAKEKYNDANKHKFLYEANREIIGDNPDLIHPGQKLLIPPANATLPISIEGIKEFETTFKNALKKDPERIELRVHANRVFKEITTTMVENEEKYEITSYYYMLHLDNVFQKAIDAGLIAMSQGIDTVTDEKELKKFGVAQQTATKRTISFTGGRFKGRSLSVLVSVEPFVLQALDNETKDSFLVQPLKGFYYCYHFRNWKEELQLSKNYELDFMQKVNEDIQRHSNIMLRPIESIADVNFISLLYNEINFAKYEKLKEELPEKLKNELKADLKAYSAIEEFEKHGMALLFFSAVNRLTTNSNTELNGTDYLLTYIDELFTLEDIIEYVLICSKIPFIDENLAEDFWGDISATKHPTIPDAYLDKSKMSDVLYYLLLEKAKQSYNETINYLNTPKQDAAMPILKHIIKQLKINWNSE